MHLHFNHDEIAKWILNWSLCKILFCKIQIEVLSWMSLNLWLLVSYFGVLSYPTWYFLFLCNWSKFAFHTNYARVIPSPLEISRWIQWGCHGRWILMQIDFYGLVICLVSLDVFRIFPKSSPNCRKESKGERQYMANNKPMKCHQCRENQKSFHFLGHASSRIVDKID